MRFRFEHRFAASPEAVAAAYADPALYATFSASTKLAAPEVLACEAGDDGQVTLKIRYRFIGDLSAGARAVLDPSRLTWVVTSVHEPAQLRSTFTLRADHYADRLRSSGTDTVSAADVGARRITEGELRVKAPLVGGTVERVLVQDLDDHLATEVATVESFIAG